jgi:sodium pump decarboxylase gamma subunit
VVNALNEITVTGAPAIVTALGMGTVFLCLVLLYVITRLVGRLVPRLLRSAQGAASAESVESAAEAGAVATAAAAQESPAGDEAIVAAMTIALARHRLSRARSFEEPRGADPWKIAGRIRTLRAR